MKILATLDETVPDTQSDRLPLLAGLITAAVTAWLLFSILRLPRDWPLAAIAAIHILSIVAANALGVKVAGSILRQNVDGLARRSCSSAAWLAPLAVYLGSGSAYAIPMAAIVVAGAAPLFRIPEAAPRRVVDDRIFHLLDPPPMSRLLSLVCAGFCIQASLATGAAGTLELAVAFISTGSAVIAWHGYALRDTASVGHPSREVVSAGLTVVFALLLTTAGLSFGTGGSGDGMENEPVDGPGGKYWGVYLWTAVASKPQQLVSMPGSSRALAHDRIKVPLKIRFDGVYWFFKWPNFQPPPRAIVMHGSPEDFGFRSADDIPLMVEAHQNLADHVDLTSFQRIEVTIRNADVYPGTVKVELILNDSQTPGLLLSLGQADVVSTIPFQQKPPVERLSFPVPNNPAPSSFDGLTIRFHLHPARATHGPRIAVDDLVLIPRSW